MADLRTNYQDDVLDASKNTARVYDLVNSDGNVVLAGVHLEDKTVYTTEGDDYGAADINTQNGKINELSNDLTDVNNSKVSHFSSGTYSPVTGLSYDQTNKKLGLKVNGADTVIPFKSGFNNETTPIVVTSSMNASKDGVVIPVNTNSYYSSQYVSLYINNVLKQTLQASSRIGRLFPLKKGDTVRVSAYDTTYSFALIYYYE